MHHIMWHLENTLPSDQQQNVHTDNAKINKVWKEDNKKVH